MKNSSLFGLFVALFLMGSSALQAATGITLQADLKAALPSGQFFLPAPPEVGSLVWQDDSTKYFQYKEASRVTTPEGVYWDSIWAKINEQYYMALYRVAADSVMDAPFISVTWTKVNNKKYNVSFSRNETDFPAMNHLELLCEQMKEDGTSGLWRTRPRPYCYFGDWYAGKKYAKDLTNASSYPSGHGYFAGLFGSAMLYIDPDNSLAIKKMMDEWMECRLILGAHWNTDLSAGWQLGAMTFAIAMNYSQFKDAVLAAKAELEAYRKLPTAPQRIPDDTTGTQTLADAQKAISGSIHLMKTYCDNNPMSTLDLEISRTFYCDGYYNSLSLPFDIAEEDWTDAEKNPLAAGTLKRFVKAEVIDNVLNITIETATSVEAGVPYLIKFEQGDDIEKPVFKGIQVSTAQGDSTTSEAMNCKGTFVPMNIPTGNNGYLILGIKNSLYWPKNDSEYLRGFRAYFKVNDNQQGVAARKATSAQLAEQTTSTSDSPIHQFTDSPIYKLIDDGEVIIVKDGVKYDVQGQIR